jgi:hypothetical protein
MCVSCLSAQEKGGFGAEFRGAVLGREVREFCVDY